MIYIYKNKDSNNQTKLCKANLDLENLEPIEMHLKNSSFGEENPFNCINKLISEKNSQKIYIETNMKIITLDILKNQIDFSLQRNEYILSIVEFNKDNNYYLIFTKN